MKEKKIIIELLLRGKKKQEIIVETQMHTV